jgi:hypothetical protein
MSRLFSPFLLFLFVLLCLLLFSCCFIFFVIFVSLFFVCFILFSCCYLFCYLCFSIFFYVLSCSFPLIRVAVCVFFVSAGAYPFKHRKTSLLKGWLHKTYYFKVLCCQIHLSIERHLCLRKGWLHKTYYFKVLCCQD